MIGCSKSDIENYPKRLLNEGIKNLGLKCNLRLALMGLRTTGS